MFSKFRMYICWLLVLTQWELIAQEKPIIYVSDEYLNKLSSNNSKNLDTDLNKYFNFLKPYFQELDFENISIKKKNQIIPFTSTPSVLNIIRKKSNWKYKIKISSGTIPKLQSIIMDSLSLNGRLGVLGHELSHVSDFHSHNRLYLIKVLFWHLNSTKMDSFEYNTDLICIKHGLGYQLLAWSEDTKKVITKGSLKDFFKTERYMYPETIKKYIAEFEIYK